MKGRENGVRIGERREREVRLRREERGKKRVGEEKRERKRRVERVRREGKRESEEERKRGR